MLGNVKMTPSASGLILYYHPYSFYSQKVMMTMHEKRLEFTPVLINITRGEQYSSEYLRINPRGEVPVLQDNGKVIPDSSRIIDYLEDNFSNGSPRLMPVGDGRRKVDNFRRSIDLLPVGAITMGSFFHPELCDRQKLPFLKPVRKILKNGEMNSVNNLRKCAEENPEVRSVLLKKAEMQERKHNLIIDKDEYAKILDSVERVLDRVESELAEHSTPNSWLCSEEFTLADVSLVVLLVRLDLLGLDSYFWKNKRSKIEDYYTRAQQRRSFKETIPDLCSHLKILAASQSRATNISVGIIGAIGVVSFVAMVLRKIL